MVGVEPTTYGLRNRRLSGIHPALLYMNTIRQALREWQAVADVGKRPATVLYHAELFAIFQQHFPRLDASQAEISRAECAEFLGRVSHYSAPRYNAVLAVLKCVVPGCPPVRRRRVQPKAVHLPGQLEFDRILAELDRAHRGHAGLAVRFLALTGCRIGEARKLTWQDVGPEGVTVPAAITKSGRSRALPLIPGLIDVLNRLRGVPPERATILPHANLKTALAAACARAGVARLTHHDLRRLFATRVIEAGVDLPTAARWLGHQDGGALLGKTYFSLLDGHSREMARKVTFAQNPTR